MKTITVNDEVLEALDKLGIEYHEGDSYPVVDWYDIRPYAIGFFIGLSMVGISFLIIELLNSFIL